jgi:hypothetical protein
MPHKHEVMVQISLQTGVYDDTSTHAIDLEAQAAGSMQRTRKNAGSMKTNDTNTRYIGVAAASSAAPIAELDQKRACIFVEAKQRRHLRLDGRWRRRGRDLEEYTPPRTNRSRRAKTAVE